MVHFELAPLSMIPWLLQHWRQRIAGWKGVQISYTGDVAAARLQLNNDSIQREGEGRRVDCQASGGQADWAYKDAVWSEGRVPIREREHGWHQDAGWRPMRRSRLFDIHGSVDRHVYGRTRKPEPEDEIRKVRHNIRRVKGVLLSTRNFPTKAR
ncbi:hypothetical protein EDB81DRAFT_301918 [Dactylonectria macrodidyma]|uniref:Uncharacterized protein n=1 Tax=Dactylonectria macrodidyma TaxID=307937 RepID=A0A9P9D7Y5_9HYPO|nr:hypothetical protein EDB81DRAFT_301918 [Dactylonectria macrodidyma]